MYYYFVSFHHKRGFGNCCVRRSTAIISGDDINSVEENISKEFKISNVTILYYKLLRKYPDDK